MPVTTQSGVKMQAKRRKKSKEVSQIARLSKGKRGKNLVSTVALDHVCVHV